MEKNEISKVNNNIKPLNSVKHDLKLDDDNSIFDKSEIDYIKSVIQSFYKVSSYEPYLQMNVINELKKTSLK